MDTKEIDIERLRNDLTNYFGTSLINDYAMADLINVESCSSYDLINIAVKNGFDLDDYIQYTR